MSKTLTAIKLLIDTFSEYAIEEGDNKTLTKTELKKLLETELGDLLSKADDKNVLDKLFEALDQNKDKIVDFKEFISFVGCITVICHEFFSCKA